jgi:hypothetical protein
MGGIEAVGENLLESQRQKIIRKRPWGMFMFSIIIFFRVFDEFLFYKFG